MVAVTQLEPPGKFQKMNIASMVVVQQIGHLLLTLAPAAAWALANALHPGSTQVTAI